MALDFKKIENMLRDEVELSESMDVDSAVARTVKILEQDIDKKDIERFTELVLEKYDIQERDAKAAFIVLREYYLSLIKKTDPFHNFRFKLKLKLFNFEIFKAIEAYSNMVVFEVRNGKNCPMLKACKHKLKKCKEFCLKHFKYEMPMDPGASLILNVVNPKLQWQLVKYREKVGKPCIYSITIKE